MNLSRLQDAVLAQMAALHIAAIPGGFLAGLGPDILRRVYGAIVTSPYAFTLVATRDGAVVGFLCASVCTRKVQYRILVREWPHLLPIAMRSLFRPSLIWKLGELAAYTFRPRGNKQPVPAAEILNLCVDDRCRGCGIGSQLFAAMECEYRRRGIESISIVTGVEQREAQRLYERKGAQRVCSTVVHSGTASVLFVHQLRTLRC